MARAAVSVLGLPDWLGKPLAVSLIDLLLAGDNALMIALVCLSLPPRSRRWVLVFGTLGAVVLRVLLVGLAGSALAVPGLKLVGGGLLALLALNLAPHDPRRVAVVPALDERSDVLAAASLVTLIDVLMSLDNALALAAVAGDSLLYLGVGLLLSVAIVMFASALVAHWLGRFPALARLGAVLLGWVAGQMAVSDALLRGWIAVQAPALPLLVPALVAAYVYLLGRNAPTPMPAPDVTAARPSVRPPRRPRQAVAAPIAAAPPGPPDMQARESNHPELLALVILVAVFAVAGLLLGVLAVLGNGLIR
jgi:YjbE family integral membrane protein